MIPLVLTVIACHSHGFGPLPPPSVHRCAKVEQGWYLCLPRYRPTGCYFIPASWFRRHR